MKQIIITLAITLMTFGYANSQNKSIDTLKIKKTQVITQQNNTSGATYTPTYTETNDEGITVESVVIEDSIDDTNSISSNNKTYRFDANDLDLDFINDIGKTATAGMVFALFVVALVFGFPIIIIILALYFRNRNRREKYRLVEKALENGQPIPAEFIKETTKGDTESEGIKNICLGIGLFIFLWALTHSFGLGCIGILIFFIGLGQYINARKNRPNKKD